MAKGARLFPLQVTRLYERMVAVVDRKRKEPTKMYYKTKKGRHFIERYTPCLLYTSPSPRDRG